MDLIRAIGCTFLPMLDELQTLITRHVGSGEPAAADGVVQTAIDGVLVSSVTEEVEAVAPTSGTVFAVIAQGGKRLAVGERVYEYRAGQYLVASLDLPVTGSHWYATEAEPALGFGLVLDPSAVASLLLEAADQGAWSPRRSPSGAAPPGVGVADARPSCSTPSFASCASSTAHVIGMSWRR